MKPLPDDPPIRSTYRHGDLKRSLLEAGIALARESGPGAVTLREATRRAGVVPNAAYRHFASHAALLDAVRNAALSALAVTIERHLRALGPERADPAYARDTLRAVGAGYLRFARDETGLFRTAFVTSFGVSTLPDSAKAGESGLNPFELLSAALNRLARSGAMSPERRRSAEYLAWSAVHGMAMLAIDGPLRALPDAKFDELADSLLQMVERGLADASV